MDWQTNGHVIIQISQMDRLPNFIGMHGAPLACMIHNTWSSSMGRKLKGAFKNLKNNANMNE